nr:MAG TPA: hypothetical protein [Caudoviricetes sp.]
MQRFCLGQQNRVAEALRPAGAAWSKGLGCCPTSPCKARGFVHTKTLLAAAVLVPQRPACRGLALLFYSCRKIRKFFRHDMCEIGRRFITALPPLHSLHETLYFHRAVTAKLSSAPGRVQVR